MARSRSSGEWLREHFTDPFVKRAHAEGFRSRAVYKLKEIDERDHLFRPGQRVVDLGAAPGGWSQYAQTRVGRSGMIIALDLLPMAPVAGVDFWQGDFTEDAALDWLVAHLDGRPADLVISDMAPNISGIAAADQAKCIYLGELTLDFAVAHLADDGACLFKTFQGAGFPDLLRRLRADFRTTGVRKPEASRARSAEVYLFGRGRK